MFGALFQVLDWIEQDAIEAPIEDVENTRAAIIRAGMQLAEELREHI